MSGRPKEEPTKCLMPECDNAEVFHRGICKPCYRATSRLVSLGRTSWMELEKKGYAAPPKTTPAHRAIMGSAETSVQSEESKS